MDGWIILDKPSGMTSRSAGGRIARMFGAKTFGHIGTLDPMASGLILIGLGQATKMIPYMESGIKNDKLGIRNNLDKQTDTGSPLVEGCPQGGVSSNIKEYLFTIKFGILTDTLDITGKVIRNEELGIRNNLNKQTDIGYPLAEGCPQGGVSSDMIKFAISKLTGGIMQVPPNYSAVHIGGVRAHKLARSGGEFEIPARLVKIYELELLSLNGDIADLRVVCSPGTYVRSLARDIANMCRTIGVASSIRRIQTNGVNIKNAVSLDFLENLVNNDGVADKYLQKIDFLLEDIPVLNLDNKDAVLFKNGGFIEIGIGNDELGISGLRRVYQNDKFVGIGILIDGILKPNRIIN